MDLIISLFMCSIFSPKLSLLAAIAKIITSIAKLKVFDFTIMSQIFIISSILNKYPVYKFIVDIFNARFRLQNF